MRHTHLEWLERVAKGDSNRQIADAAGVSDATLGRQVRAGELKPEMIIKIAEAYEESPAIALVDLGFMSARWITEPGVTTALSRATDEQLTDELLRRLKLLDTAPVDELAERRSSTAATLSEPSDMPFGVVADSSPEEDWDGAEFD
ncbi:helix-turn-helix domain-containing protein [Corynebacterium ulceribovis]|uniref:helix-turn-helix domain-containing protein n=1 Tax=Corynebacterium ulceribovis TaxID=487732 RepID=UPI0012EA72DF|nr:helix-turn-helix transcriptional regulator [Corynebacterium ulceribovis]